MIKDYPFASNGKSCMISISAEERPSLKLTIEASSPMDILDIYQDEYGVFFAKYFNSSVEKIEIEGIDAREILYDLKDFAFVGSTYSIPLSRWKNSKGEVFDSDGTVSNIPDKAADVYSKL